MLLLDLINPTGLGKDEDDCNADFVPLVAKWVSYGGMEIESMEGDLDDFCVEDVLEPSVWVKRMVKGFGKFVGFPIDSCEKQCIAFFQKLEEVWEKQAAAGSSLRHTNSSTKKGMRRELKILVSIVNYDGQSGCRTRGNLNSSEWAQFFVHEFETPILECKRIKQSSKEGYYEEFTQGVEM